MMSTCYSRTSLCVRGVVQFVCACLCSSPLACAVVRACVAVAEKVRLNSLPLTCVLRSRCRAQALNIYKGTPLPNCRCAIAAQASIMNPFVTVDRAPSAAVSAALAGQGSRPRMQLCCPWCPALLNRGKAAVTHFLAQHPSNFSRTPVLGATFIATSFHSTAEDAWKSLRTVAAQTGANYVPHGTNAFRCKCAPRGVQSALSSVDSCARTSVAAAAFSSPPVLSEHVTAANKRRRGICLGRASEVTM